ncbi:ATP-binding protein [Lachnospira multipara]|uniref:Uncharacterized protein YhaN n=1 Tax=Lachnospira multipara TaxID=28051 RepID=A0A1H5WE81_9FIRM|nr:AAA family ATPase [Lachnospira multipara]SEF97680.1 Uncharacterized protein YhaN [Lachnospira multipara]
MRLIRCHIENFGKLSDVTIDFDKNINCINEENGWGKTTLASFIKVMFYGFENETKRDNIAKERFIYKPWQAGAYGGQLTFEENGNTYTIERIFGEKKSADTYKLINADTKLERKKLKDNIGEELFGIDLEAFKNTVFVGQQDCQLEVKPDMSAKLTDKAEVTSDLSNFEKIIQKIKDEYNSLSYNKNSVLPKLRDEISFLTVEISKKERIESELNEANENIKATKINKLAIEEKINEIADKQKKIQEVINNADKKKEYERKQKDISLEESELEELKKSIPDKKLEVSKLNEEINKANDYKYKNKSLEEMKLTSIEVGNLEKLKALFVNGVPSNTELEEIESDIKKYNEVSALKYNSVLSSEENIKWEQLKAKYKERLPETSEVEGLMRNWEDVKSLKSNVSNKNAEVTAYNNTKSNKKNSISYMLWGIAAVAIVVAIISLAVIKLPIVGLVSGAFAVVMAVLGFVLSSNKNNDELETKIANLNLEINTANETIEKLDAKVRAFLSEFNYGEFYTDDSITHALDEVNRELIQYQSFKNRKGQENSIVNDDNLELGKNIVRKLSNYYNDISEDLFEKTLYSLKSDCTEYNRLNDKQLRYENNKQSLDNIKNELLSFNDEYNLNLELNQNYVDELYRLEKNIIKYNEIEKRVIEKREELHSFEEVNDMEALMTVDANAAEKVQEYANQNNALYEKRDALINSLHVYQKTSDELSEKLDEIEKKELELESKTELYKESIFRDEILKSTEKYLEEAKQNYLKKYSNPIKEAFDSYYSILTNDDSKKYEIDAKLEIQLIEQGTSHNIAHLSAGYSDMVGLCRRLAMIDAMYTQEKPFLIFDDPFVNLDEDKIQGGKNFLKKISEKYQIIYFTCHDSRVIEN